MNLIALEYFVVVAKTLNISAAADQLYVSQPAISKQIQNLEAELGVKLFRRTRPNLTLTQVGTSILVQAEQILALSRSMVKNTHSFSGQVTDPLHIGYSGTLDFGVLLSCAAKMAEKYPLCELKFSKCNMSVLYTNLLKNYYDMIFTPLTGLQSDDRLETVSAVLAPFVLAVSNAHPLAGRESVSLAELRDEKFVIFLRNESQAHSDMLVLDCQKAGFSPNIAAEVADVQTYLLLIAANQGVAVVGANLRSMSNNCITYIPIQEYQDVNIQIGAAWLRSNHNPSRIVFTNILMEEPMITF